MDLDPAVAALKRKELWRYSERKGMLKYITWLTISFLEVFKVLSTSYARLVTNKNYFLTYINSTSKVYSTF